MLRISGSERISFPINRLHRLGYLLGLWACMGSASVYAADGSVPAWVTESDSARPNSDSGTAAGNALNGADADPVRTPAGLSADPLLPQTLGPGEKLFWGERGLMRSIGAFPLTEESRERELGLRRSMLTLHQVGGFFTLASMIATAYCGQMILNGESGYEGAKSALAWTTVGAYFATASLALLSPPPVIRRSGWSSVSTHKALAWAHFTGMIITPILGAMIEDEGDVRTLHQVSGYVTTVAFAGAMFVITF